MAATGVEQLQRSIAGNPGWYHTIELAEGIQTPGVVDLRELAGKALPDRLDGLRALDVGTFDGFWAFEMERRGAEVVATDVERLGEVELPPVNRARLQQGGEEMGFELGRGFAIASEALDSRVRRVICNVYDLTPEILGGPVDFAFSGSILLHLRDPVRALERLYDTLAPGGRLVLMEPVSIYLTALAPRRPIARFQPLETNFNWWVPNLAGLRALAQVAGFTQIRRLGFVRPPSTRRMRQTQVILACSRPVAAGTEPGADADRV